MKTQRVTSGGKLIFAVILIIAILILLGSYGLSVRKAVESPAAQDNLHYVWGVVVWIWKTYVAGLAQLVFGWLIRLFIAIRGWF